VTLLKSARYLARVTSDAGKRLSLGTFDTSAEAQDAIDIYYETRRVRSKYSHARIETKPAPLFVTVYDQWAKMKNNAKKKSGNSVKRRADFRRGYVVANGPRALAAGRVPLGNFRVDELTFEILEAWLRAQQEDEGFAPSTLINNWRIVHAVLEYARKRPRRYIAENPIKEEYPLDWGDLTEHKKKPFLLTLPEIIRLTECFPADYRLFCDGTAWSGMRNSETRALRVDDLFDRFVVVDEALESEIPSKPTFGGTKTEASQRRVMVPAPVIRAMEANARSGQHGPVFEIKKPRKQRTNPDGSPARYHLLTDGDVGSYFRRARKRAGLVPEVDHPNQGRRPYDATDLSKGPFPTAHDLRRTVVTMLFELGASEPEVQTWVGHEQGSTVTRKHYAGVRPYFESDPVLVEVRMRQDLSLAEKWALLYERAWEEYGTTGPGYPTKLG